MPKKKIDDIVSEMALGIVAKHSYELVDVEFVKEGGNWYLRIFIDKPDGITIDDCQIVSEEISDKLDETDPIKQSYMLEVSSPGLDRPLKKESDFIKYKGQDVEVKLFEPINGKKLYEGELVGLQDNMVIIKTHDDLEFKFPFEKAATVKRVIKF